MPLDQFRDPHDYELSVAASRPFDFHAWLATLQHEFVFFRVDLHNRINYIAPSIRAILGYAPEDLLGTDFRETFDLAHPMRAKLLDLSDRLSVGDPPGLRRTVARRKDGTLAFLALRDRDIVTNRGLQGREYMAKDVTARIEAELSLRQSERKYRRLVEGLRSDYIIYARDARGMITYVSPSSKKVLGFEPEELVGTYAHDVYSDVEYGRRVVSEFARDAENGKMSNRVVAEMKHRDGGSRIIEIQERPVFAIDGRLASVEGIAKDVTETVASERAIRELTADLERRVALRTEALSRMNEDLRASEARYRDVVETLNDFIVRWKPDGTRTFVNEAFSRFHGVEASDIIGTTFVPTIHVDDQATFQKVLAGFTPANPSATYEIRVLRLDGSYPWVQWNTRAKYDPSGQLIEFQSVGRNVTELKAAADLIRQKEAHLAHLSRLATMGEMVAGIAHEINQPLHAAKTFAEAARRNLQAGSPEKIQTAIDCTSEISYAITRTVEIIRRLRDFTKAQPFELESLSLSEVIREAVELTGYEMRRLGASVRLDLDKNLPSFPGDRIQMEQLIVNLLMNGYEAMEDIPVNERTIDIRSRVRGESLILEVSDAGNGIAESEMPRLFEAFFTTKAEGMGMGLVLCKSIAEAHGGQLHARRNDPHRGMTFQLEIPLSGGSS